MTTASPEICSQRCVKRRTRTANKSASAEKDDATNSQKVGLRPCSSSQEECLDSGGTLGTAQERGLSFVKIPGTKMSCYVLFKG